MVPNTFPNNEHMSINYMGNTLTVRSSYEVYSKLRKGGYIGDYIGEYCRAYKGGC